MNAPQLFTNPTPPPAPQPARTRRRPTKQQLAQSLSNLTRQTRCPHCGAITAEALDAPTLAFHVRLDPTNITQPTDELALLLAGRRTYTATPDTAPGRYRLHRRDSYEQVRTARAPHRPVVLAEHHCGNPAPGQPLPSRSRATTSRCPF